MVQSFNGSLLRICKRDKLQSVWIITLASRVSNFCDEFHLIGRRGEVRNNFECQSVPLCGNDKIAWI